MMMIKLTVEDVLLEFSGRSNAASTLGAQLDSMMLADAGIKRNNRQDRAECSKCGSKVKRRSNKAACACGGTLRAAGAPLPEMHISGDETPDVDFESNVLRGASMARCLSDLGRIRDTTIDVPVLLHVAASQRRAIGGVVVATLGAFQAALASPSDEDLARANSRASKATPARREEVRQRALAEYRAPRGLDAVQRTLDIKDSSKAAELYADCVLVVASFLRIFNARKP